MNKGPNWPSAFVAVAFLAALTAIVLTVYSRDGLDGALKAWGAMGTLVGVVVGAIPSYFFRQAAEKAQRDANTLRLAADPGTVQRARELGLTS